MHARKETWKMRSTAPRSSLDAPRAYVVKAMRALSPPSANRKTAANTTTPRLLSGAMLSRLQQIVAYLDATYPREEGLYRRQGDAEECAEIKRLCMQDADQATLILTSYTPHAIATVWKQMLAEGLEPLLSYSLSERLIERAAGRDEAGIMQEVLLVWAELDSEKRAVLRVVLNHFNKISTCIACRMTAKDLAAHVAIHLIRPSEDIALLQSASMLKRRRRLAKLLIENITALPDDETKTSTHSHGHVDQELHVDVTTGTNATDSEVFYVQVLWDNAIVAHDEASLQSMLGQFGDISNLAINESGNRAIVAFTSADRARAASTVDLPGLRVRFRKQRGTTQDLGTRSSSPTEGKRSPSRVASDTSDISLYEAVQRQATTNSDTKMASDDTPAFLHKLERPPSLLLHQRAMQSADTRDQMKLEDVESLPPTPRGDLGTIVEGPDTAESSTTNDEHTQAARQGVSAPVDLRVSTIAPAPLKKKKSIFSPTSGNKLALIADLKVMLGKKPKAVLAHTSNVGPAVAEHISIPTRVMPQPRSVATQTRRVTVVVPLMDQATDTSDLPRAPDEITTCLSCDAAQVASLRLEERANQLGGCLQYVLKETLELEAALSATKQRDVDQAVGRVLCVLTQRMQETIRRGEVECDNSTPDLSIRTATRDFVHFLETRSKTQITILEAEIRAGQELLRLHRSQHETEVNELEKELAGLRSVKIETEKMCSEVRSDLRRCRNELTCHVANTASLQREKRDVDEKLVLCQSQLKAKEQEALELRASLVEMRDVAAQAQQRLEEVRAPGLASVSKFQISRGSGAAEGKSQPLPTMAKASAFLKQHQSTNGQKPSRLSPGAYSNSVELAAMQERLRQQIQQQVVITRKALDELQVFETDSTEDHDLEQLQQRLATATTDMELAMGDSRHQLNQILGPRSTTHKETATPKQSDPTEIVERLLNNVLSMGSSGEEDDRLDQSVMRGFGQVGPIEPPLSERWRHVPAGEHSQLYRKWLHERAPTAPTSRPQNARSVLSDTNSLREAQQSMQRFQDALASLTTRPT